MRTFIKLLLVVALLFLVPTISAQIQTLDFPSASTVTNLQIACNDSEVTLSWEGPSLSSTYAVRVDDGNNVRDEDVSHAIVKTNTCDSSNTHDVCINDWQSNSITLSINPEKKYDWWIHEVSSRQWSDGVSGESFSCGSPNESRPTPTVTSTPVPTSISTQEPIPEPLPAPPDVESMTATCQAGDIAYLSWKPVDQATEYSVRVDNLENPWNGRCEDADNGDLCITSSDPSILINIEPDSDYRWWVHSVGAGGWSEGVLGPEFICTSPPTTTVAPPRSTVTPSRIPLPTNTPTEIPTLTPTPTVAPIIVLPSEPPASIDPETMIVSCEADGREAVLSWEPADKASEYAVRIDDMTDPWSEKCETADSNDLCVVNSDTSLRINIAASTRYRWWIHSIGDGGWSEGVFGPQFICAAPTATPTQTPTPTATSTPIPTNTPTSTPTPTPTNTPTRTPTPTFTPSPTQTPTPTNTPTLTPTLLPTATRIPVPPTATPTAIPTSVSPSPTAVATQEPTQQPTTILIPSEEVSPTPVCPRKAEGDANCNNTIELLDFAIWRQEYLTGRTDSLSADFNSQEGVNVLDFAIWRQGYMSEQTQ